MARKDLQKQLEDRGLELHLARKLLPKLNKLDEESSREIPRIMLEELATRNYKGDLIDITCIEKPMPLQVDPKAALKHVPIKDIADMIEVDRAKFEAYLRSKGIDLSPDEYLVSPGKYNSLTTYLKVSLDDFGKQLRRIYASFKNLVTFK